MMPLMEFVDRCNAALKMMKTDAFALCSTKYDRINLPTAETLVKLESGTVYLVYPTTIRNALYRIKENEPVEFSINNQKFKAVAVVDWSTEYGIRLVITSSKGHVYNGLHSFLLYALLDPLCAPVTAESVIGNEHIDTQFLDSEVVAIYCPLDRYYTYCQTDQTMIAFDTKEQLADHLLLTPSSPSFG